ncbi:hypothetical protein FNH22_20015 [Fulvivirga sp. M361]|uniref:hypothetical protein n=1 Tax=Fulvivirga sp. M361 TaxID=2594266 RepID=UPI00117AD1F2|nr:hypothetical protein [Fulvivirga sp. M361]TRX53647.1 hypothetical protein FNH22_20015 [Fulvivirga sp. M361]
MKKAALLCSVLSLAFLFLFSCWEESVDISAPELAIENSVKPFNVEELAFNGTLDSLTGKANRFARISCTLNSLQDCGSVMADDVIDDFIRLCARYPFTPDFGGSVVNYYFNFNYYVDSNANLRLDQYEDDIQAQVDAIATSIGQPLFLALGDVQAWPCTSRQNNSGSIKYTVYY